MIQGTANAGIAELKRKKLETAIPQPLATEPKRQPELPRKLAAQEKEMIEAALRESGGQVSGAAGAAVKLGLPGCTLESKIRSFKIDKKRFKTTNPSADRI